MTHPLIRLSLASLLTVAASAALAQTPGIAEREWKAWLDDVRPFFSASEAAAAKTVPAAERGAFRDAFWDRRASTPTAGSSPLREQIEARIRAADKRYRVKGTGAWNDCGRAYVLLGKLDWVNNQVADAHFAGSDREIGSIRGVFARLPLAG